MIIFQTPSTEEEWMKIADAFEEKWNFPNCIGAMDGKHIVIKQSKNSGSYFFNYKGTFSIVLLALVDAEYKFLYVDVGCNGRVSDGGVFRNALLSRVMEENFLAIPAPRLVGGQRLPYVVVADDAFPLKENLIKPIPSRGLSKEQRITNYRISRARRTSENAFGIMANRFCVILSPMQLKPENVQDVTLASCVLHNFLREKKISTICNGDNGNEKSFSSPLGKNQTFIVSGRNNHSNSAKEVREKFNRYFNSAEGSVSWQEDFA